MAAAVRRLFYISPRFPWISLTFEQNEILGLLGAGIGVRVLSCRPAPRSGHQLHEFARPIADVVEYPRLMAGATGFVHALLRRPGALAGILGSLATATRNPLALPRTFGAFWFALGWYHRWAAEPPDWVHADFGQNSATAAMFLGRLLERPFSFKVHAFDIFDERASYRDPLRSEKVERAAVVFSEHGFGRSRLEQLVEGCEPKVRVNYSSVRITEFRRLPIPAGSRRFVALGRLAAKKGFHVLVEAAAILREPGHDVRIHIFGRGPEERSLRALIASRGVGDIVQLMGAYDNGQLPDMLRDCLALVMPSVITATRDMDGVPTVIYEAMALGRPVIASRLSGIPEVVRDGVNGLLVAPGDPRSLADAMARFLEGAVCADTMGRAGREAVERNHNHLTAATALLREMEAALDPMPSYRATAVAERS